MSRKAAIKAEADRLRGTFEARGAEVFETDVLQPAGALLDLYGEDIRARAFVTHDPLRGEMMLRPDFTIPLVQRHMGEGRRAGPLYLRGRGVPPAGGRSATARRNTFRSGSSCSTGRVRPRPTPRSSPPSPRSCCPWASRPRWATSVFCAPPSRGCRPAPRARPHSSTISGVRAASGRFSAATRNRAKTARSCNPSDPLAGKVEVGLRTAEEILARLDHLRDDREVPPLPRDEIALVDALLAVRGKAHDAVSQLRDLAIDLPSIGAAVDRLTDRFDALEGRGVDLRRLDFEAAYGRTTLEYYDGFVFGFYAEGRPGLPPVASGGRYDALTRAIGGGDGVPAVGGVIRPGLLIDLGMAA